MKQATPTRLGPILRRADPLPYLLSGYLIGLLLSALRCLEQTAIAPPLPLSASSLSVALEQMWRVELPIILAVVAASATRYPLLCRIPVCWRGLLFGYGSLQIYWAVGRSALYFRYVLASCALLLPLCCLARLSARLAASHERPGRQRLVRHMAICLFYIGLILLTLPLRR